MFDEAGAIDDPEAQYREVEPALARVHRKAELPPDLREVSEVALRPERMVSIDVASRAGTVDVQRARIYELWSARRWERFRNSPRARDVGALRVIGIGARHRPACLGREQVDPIGSLREQSAHVLG